MRNTGLEEAQAEIKIAGRNINNLRYADDTTLMAESEEELISLLMKVKEESEKVGLKLNTEKTKIMATGPITSWEIDGETMETVTNFLFLGPKSLQVVTAAMKLKDACFLVGAGGGVSYDKPRQWIKKQRHHFCPYSRSYGFSSSHIWIWELDLKEGWAPKNWWFQIVMLQKTLESPLDTKEITPVNPKGN